MKNFIKYYTLFSIICMCIFFAQLVATSFALWSIILSIFETLFFAFVFTYIKFLSEHNGIVRYSRYSNLDIISNFGSLYVRQHELEQPKKLFLSWKPFKGYCFVFDGECSKFYKTKKKFDMFVRKSGHV